MKTENILALAAGFLLGKIILSGNAKIGSPAKFVIPMDFFDPSELINVNEGWPQKIKDNNTGEVWEARNWSDYTKRISLKLPEDSAQKWVPDIESLNEAGYKAIIVSKDGQTAIYYTTDLENSFTPKTAKDALPIGTILYSSWGYDQTNIDFYVVRKVGNTFFEVEELSQKMTRAAGDMSEYVMPGEPNGNFYKGYYKQTKSKYGPSVQTKLTVKGRWAGIWDGRELYQSHYA